MYDNSSRNWRLGDNIITESVKYNHLGIFCNKYFGMNDTVYCSSTRLRGTLLSLTKCDLSYGSRNPLTLVKIYQSVVIPKALYGCELWNALHRVTSWSFKRRIPFASSLLTRIGCSAEHMCHLPGLFQKI